MPPFIRFPPAKPTCYSGTMRLYATPILYFILILLSPKHSFCGVDSFFATGISFFRTADLAATADDLGSRSLSPAADSDFLLSFGNRDGLSYLGGFGFLWSRRTEKPDDISFTPDEGRARFQLLGFPFSLGVVNRFGEEGNRGWAGGVLAHYYFIQISVDNPNSAEGDPRYFRLQEDNRAERDAQGPGLTAFAVYEFPIFLGRFGMGVKGRWTSLEVKEINGMSTPEVDLSGITLFLSIALVD